MARTLGVTLGVWAVILLIGALIMGTLTHRLAGHKGYTGYFWTGFFLGFVGLVYVVGLPVKTEAR